MHAYCPLRQPTNPRHHDSPWTWRPGGGRVRNAIRALCEAWLSEVPWLYKSEMLLFVVFRVTSQ